jgi:hypothetical protein
MFAFESIAGGTMVEVLFRWLPVNEVEVLSVVFQVAAHAIFALRILHLKAEVKAVFVRQGFRDFLMAIEAFKCGSTRTEDVAGITLRCAVERGMCLGERAGGNLSARLAWGEKKGGNEQN